VEGAGRNVRAVAGLVLAVALLASAAQAHPLAPSLLEARELGGERVAFTWKTPRLTPSGARLVPELPSACRTLGPPRDEADGTGLVRRWTADCGPRGLVGRRLAVRGLARTRTEALARVELADGRRIQAVLRAGEPELVVPERAAPRRVALQYVGLGFRHILEGVDHLLFVLALLLLVSSGRLLVATVTAFTLGHSLTLALAVLGFVRAPTGLVELAIAGSILVLAVDLARPGAQIRGGGGSFLRRRPWAAAAAFGLLHGLGFAGALAEVGVPAGEIPLALLSFNVGIELGQLLFVAAVLAAEQVIRPLGRRGPGWLSLVPAYGIGSLAALFCFERASDLVRAF
jgi:hypothetical protein